LIRRHQLRSWLVRAVAVAFSDDRAAQLVEFAVSLPLLVVFVVGIFDFSGAYTLKQKLTNAARDAARAAAADPANDLAQPTSIPASVSDAFQQVDNYLIANKIDDCGMLSSLYTSGPAASWKFSVTPSGSSTCGITLIINRGYFFPAVASARPANVDCLPPAPTGAQIQVIATCVSIKYAYQWRFGRVVSLLGSSASLPTNIVGTAVVMNEN
jgi:hypothetical protein